MIDLTSHRRLRSMTVTALAAALLFATLVSDRAAAAIIGPDSAGYTGSDTALPFSFVDISATGANLNLDIGDSALANFGFTFNFYGTPYTSAMVNSNGYLHFGPAPNDLMNRDLTTDPAPISNQNIPGIFPYWDDWDPTPGGLDNVYVETRGAPGARYFIAQWENVKNFNTGQRGTFQAVLAEGSNTILFQYEDVTAAGNGAGGTIGIRNTGAPNNGQVLQLSFNSQATSNEMSLLFTPVPEPCGIALATLAAALLGLRRRRTYA